jgi:hypothetical protein
MTVVDVLAILTHPARPANFPNPMMFQADADQLFGRPESAKSINSYAKPIRGRIAYAEALVFQGYERPRRG